MSKLAKALQAAAGNSALAGELANAIDFDGTSDYLLRSSALTGSADGKTFTFSAWVYISKYLSSYNTVLQGNGQAFNFSFGSDNFYIKCLNSSNTAYPLDVAVDLVQAPKDTFIHILASIDMTSQAATRIYVNDVLQTLNFRSAFVNTNLDLTPSSVAVGALTNGSNKFQGRISNLYLDYTYRNLDVVANRRLFITDDLKPADGQADLNPILYLPLDDPEDIGNNAGTGGNFTVNGVMARSGRGPNQDNCVASKFDGSNDYLSKSGFGVLSSQTATFSFLCKSSDDGQSTIFSSLNESSSNVFIRTTLNRLQSDMKNAANGRPFEFSLSGFPVGVTNSVQIAIDTTNINKCKVYVNGVDVSASAGIQIIANSFMVFNNVIEVARERFGSTNYYAGDIGEFYFDTTYTDLSTNNPFWDADANRPKPVRQVLEETGNTPLIAMPLVANNAGLNLGTGGNFTVNSGPYVGARGGSEYWARSMNKLTWVNNSTLSVSTKTFSFVFAVKPPDATARHAINYTNGRLDLCIPSTTTERIYYAGGSTSLNITHNLYMGSALNWFIYFISVDMDDQSKTRWYVKPLESSNTLAPSLTFSSFSTGNPVTFENFAVNMQSGSYSNYEMSSVYFSTSYIDFSQEAERLKFADAFGYPLDIAKQIEDGVVPTPTFYLPFDTPSNFGRNLGSGGDFTVNGTSQYNGSDVSPP